MSLLTRRTPPPRVATVGNFATTCGSCVHSWHGLQCRATLCNCPTSWTEPGQ